MDERVSPGVVDRVAYRNRESRRLLDRAAKSVAKGASSTMRVLDYHLPLVIDRADGAHVWDADGNELIDMNMGYGLLSSAIDRRSSSARLRPNSGSAEPSSVSPTRYHSK